MITAARAGGALLALAIATGSVPLGTAPAANASCVSAFGLSSGPDCESGFGSIAIAIGSNAIAQANGVLGVAIAVGTQSRSAITAGSVFTLASAMGTFAATDVKGILSATITAGNRGRTDVGFGGGDAPQFGNVALNFGNHTNVVSNEVSATGFGNLGVNVGGDAVIVDATGLLNNATNLFGSGIVRTNGGALSWAFNVYGSNNNVTAGPGFLAVAGSLGQSGATVTQKPFGININGVAIPAAASVNALRNNRKSVAPKPNQSTSAKASKKGTARSARG